MTLYMVTAFYKFTKIPDKAHLQAEILQKCQFYHLQGSILLADEGINGTIAGFEVQLKAFWQWLGSLSYFHDLEFKESWCEKPPFLRMKVRLKKEIVTLKQPHVNPIENTGQYISSQQWNDLIQSPDTLVIDVRNLYETKLGTFKNAIDPNTDNFNEFPKFVETYLPAQKHKKVAMFCTGGIRCVKASAYMLAEGFEEVYQLEGGILKYLEEIPQSESLWQGECFVFDQRVTVDHHLTEGTHKICFACRHPLNAFEYGSADFQEGISCPHCIDQLTPQQQQKMSERQRQINLAHVKGSRHLGPRINSLK